jgi:hypothetical protein
LAVTWAAVTMATAQTITESFTLQPGWNAIWLRVQPQVVSVAEVFSDVPVESVWTLRESLSSVEFIENPNEPVWNKSKWLVHIPTNRIESLHNSLVAIYAGRAYLVNLATNTPVVWQVTGRPPLR